jgi:Tol biopolymer transport system component
LYENQAKEWFKGHVSAPEKKVAIPVALTPACKSDDIVDARISNNGAKVAWITQGRIRRDRKVFPQSVLIVVDVVTGDTGAVVRIEREGIMAAASWSPDDTRVAFYYGEGKAYEKDGYTLQLCDLTKAGEVKEIAPPSLWLTPGAADAFRSQPAMWSPDGTGLVFQGRYTEKENERFSFVRTDGTGLTAVQGIIKGWSTDSARMLMRSGQKLMTRTPAPSANAEELRALPLPDIDMTALSSDGKYMVLQSFLSPVSRAVDVLEMESGKTRRLFDCEDGTEAWPLVWIESDRP